MATSRTDLKQAVDEIIRRHLPAAVQGTLDDDDDLRTLGLNSLRFINMLADLDRDLAIEVPDAELDFANFSTPGLVFSTVLRLRRATPWVGYVE